MTDDRQRTAACACGEVAIRLVGSPVFQAVCACRNCQKRSGSAFGMSAYFSDDQVHARRGEPTVYRRISDKGRPLDFRFCPRCGTSVWWTADFMPGKVGVAAVLFDDADFRPDGAYFCATLPDWVGFSDDIPVAQAATRDG